MGFKKPDLNDAYDVIRHSLGEIHSPYNDGWTSSYCKQELFLLKCFIEEEYKKLPTFHGEEKWQHERLIKILKQE
jgi:hypothetical protein